MARKKPSAEKANDLRKRAEEIARERAAPVPESPDALSPEDARRLLHELQVHQIELEMQNEELRRAHGELEASRARYFDLYDLAPVGYCTLSEKGLILEANLTAARLLGVARGNVAGMALSHFILPEDQDTYYLHRKRLFETDVAQACELRMRRQDGTSFWARLEVASAKDADGAPVCLAVMSDITARKQAEERLREAGLRKDEFLAMLGHELRNPLLPIRIAAHLILTRAPEDPAFRRQCEIIEQQIEHLARLVEDLLDVSRIEHGKISLRRERVDLGVVVSQVLEVCRPLIEGRQHRVAPALPDGPLYVDGDPVRLEQMVCNLLNNACKYTDDRGEIRVAVEREGGEAVVRVRDNGIGLTSEQIEKVFEPFYQADRSQTRAEGGLGIGLTLVRRLVGMHGGSVTAASKGLGKGSEFVLRLPALESAPLQTPAASVSAAPPAARGKHVLLVDDNRYVRESMETLLTTCGHRVSLAADGETGVAQALARRPDVAIVDLGLPGMSGLDVATKIRSALGRNIFLISLTGYGHESDKAKALAAGFDLHLVKPVKPQDLIRLLAHNNPPGPTEAG